MATKLKVRTKKAPAGSVSKYHAFARGYGAYGFGKSPVEARAHLLLTMLKNGDLRVKDGEYRA